MAIVYHTKIKIKLTMFKIQKTIHHEIPCQPDEKFDYHWADVEKRWSDIDYDYSSKLTTSNF